MFQVLTEREERAAIAIASWADEHITTSLTFDLAALAIGAYLPPEMMRFMHLDPEEALRAGRDLRARRVVAMHFGTFNLGAEPIGQPPVRFRAGAADAGYAPDDAWVLGIGETRDF